MSGSLPSRQKPISWREVLRRPFSGEDLGTAPADFSLYRVGPVWQRAWSLFQTLSRAERGQAAGALIILIILSFVADQTAWDSAWKWLGIWLIRLWISTWFLTLFLLPRSRRPGWQQNLPGIALFLFLVQLFTETFFYLAISAASLVGILTGWLLPFLHLPSLGGKFSPDFLLLLPPLVFLAVAGLFLLKFLLGLSLVIPLMLDRNAGLYPAVRASLASTQNYRARLFSLFFLVAALVALSLAPITVAKMCVLGIPLMFPTLLPVGSTGVWICFGLQTGALLAGTWLVLWIWPLGSALWAALYLERWKPNASS